ncbi:MAG: hypothetical protein ACREKJ_02480, partial [Candidatus Rokuibacteriota bacterium]
MKAATWTQKESPELDAGAAGFGSRGAATFAAIFFELAGAGFELAGAGCELAGAGGGLAGARLAGGGPADDAV